MLWVLIWYNLSIINGNCIHFNIRIPNSLCDESLDEEDNHREKWGPAERRGGRQTYKTNIIWEGLLSNVTSIVWKHTVALSGEQGVQILLHHSLLGLFRSLHNENFLQKKNQMLSFQHHCQQCSVRLIYPYSSATWLSLPTSSYWPSLPFCLFCQMERSTDEEG